MNILLLTQYFWPEIGAPQVIHAEWIRRLTQRGHRVHVVTSFPNYPDGVIQEAYKGRWYMREQYAGADVYRTATYAARNAGFVRRLANHLALTVSSWSALPFLGSVDVVITEYPPLFTALSGLAFSRLRGIPHVLNAGDLWVEVALELGILQKGPLASAALAGATAIEKASARVLVTSKGCIQKLASVGVDPQKVVYLPNSVDTDAFQPDSERRRRVREEWGWGDRIVCLYHGTHGLAQGLLQVVEAAHLLRDQPNLLFVLIGSGAEKDLVVRRVAELKLANVELHPPKPFAAMPGIIDASDIGLVPLKAIPMFGITLPSKMFEFMSMQKPVALAVDGDAREIVEAGGAGIFAPPENPAAYAAAIKKLAEEPALREAMGARGRALAVERYSRDRFARDLEQSLLEVVSASKQREHVSVEDAQRFQQRGRCP